MKKLVLLLLLFCWNQVIGQWLSCSTGVVITNQAISIPSSTHAGAKVLLLYKSQARSLIECLEDCCSAKYGLCSVAEFKNKSMDANCYYYSCQPVHRCKFMDSEGTDSFTFPLVGGDVSSTDDDATRSDVGLTNNTKDVVLEESTSTRDPQQRTAKDHTRAVTARKGVESISTATSDEDGSMSQKEATTEYLGNGAFSTSTSSSDGHIRTISARKGVEAVASDTSGSRLSATVMDGDVLSKSDSSFKNDNTTIKPRKGVNPDGDPSTVKIKPRKGVELKNSSQGSDTSSTTRSKVKPRKGAVPFPFPGITTLITSKTFSLESSPLLSNTTLAPEPTANTHNQPLMSHVTLTTDLISVLEQVFRDEAHTPSSGSEWRHGTPTLSISTTDSFTINSTPVPPVKYSEHTTLLATMGDISSASSSALSIAKLSDADSPSKSSVHHEKTLQSTTFLAIVADQVKHHTVPTNYVSGHMVKPSFTPVLQTSINSQNSITDAERVHHSDSTASVSSTSSPNKTLLSAISAKLENDLQNQRKYKSSMHLLLSLVFGLLVLFVVLGAVAKRVYDVWMRRHYHRMDFLIDGMYDGFS